MPIATRYEPVVRAKRGSFRGAALVGCHSMSLGWTMPRSKLPKKLMGFAVRRTQLDAATGEALRVDWLNGMKRFADPDGDFGEEVRSDQAPFQRFRWNDYSIHPGASYRYEVFPMVGKPGDLARREPLVFDVCPSQPVVDGVGIHANRGVTAAMAYLSRFGGRHPDEVTDGSAHRWLERGLKRAILDFIAAARKGESLHVCIYEFEQDEIAAALKAAKARGVNLEIVYHARKNDKATKENEAELKRFGLEGVAIPRTNTRNISHNKFIVRLGKTGRPIKLWTASANFSDNAFYFQTNVGLFFEDDQLARQYEAYFQILRGDPKSGREKQGSVFVQDSIEALHGRINTVSRPPIERILYSPVRSLHVVDAATALIARAKSAVLLSAPFGVGKEIVAAIGANSNDILEYGLANATAKKKIEGLRHGNTRFFTPSRLRTYMGRAWDAKAFGAHKIHAKTLVVDPWGENPAVLIGSANFSAPSCKENDENTLLVEGDKRFAAIVATEFLRMYDHYKIRFWINQMEDRNDEGPMFLDDGPGWSDIYYRETKTSRKLRDREVFAGDE